MKKTFLDSGVLLWAVRGKEELARKALEVLDDPARTFASSMFVKLEVLPKPICFKNEDQIEALEEIFKNISDWAVPGKELVDQAYEEACVSSLNALDALHIAAAVQVKADEFVTTEKLEKSIHRSKALPIFSIDS